MFKKESHITRCAVSILVALAALLGADQAAEEFSHKKHAATKLECVFCHVGAGKSERAGFPTAGQCMLCHQTMPRTTPLLQKLAEMPKEASPFTTKYHKLRDFVFFSHARHVKGKMECAGCHGAVYATDSVKLHMPLTMKACVDCHKSTQAKISCDSCHELGQ